MANRILVSYADFEATVQKFETQSANFQAALDKALNMTSNLESNWYSKSAKAYITKLKQKLEDCQAAKQKIDDYKRAVQEVRRVYEENESSIDREIGVLEDKNIFVDP